jgi:hypothetical protein
MVELLATASLRGGCIDLSLRRSGQERWPDLRIVRRRDGPPQTPDEGRTIFDLRDLVAGAGEGSPETGEPWDRIERSRYLIIDSHAEAGLCESEVSLYFEGPAPTPKRRTGKSVAEIDRIEVQTTWLAIE